MKQKPAVLMYATMFTEEAAKAIKSFREIGGVEPTVIGLGKLHSWQTKIQTLYDWCTQNPNRLVLHADAFDTCCVAPLPNMELRNSISFSAETNCYPDSSLADCFPASPTRYRFLNAGVWLGNSSDYVKLVDDFGMLSGVQVDQLAYTQAFLSGRSNIELDTNCKFFHNLFRAQDDWAVVDAAYRVRSTDTTPLVAHGSGASGIAAVWAKFLGEAGPSLDAETPERIAGLVVCVGDTYAQTLEATLPRWLHTLDSLCVVTRPDDQSTLQVLEDYACDKLRVFTTDCFDKDGATFNKGRAMSEAVHAGAVDTSAWVLTFDADVLPPLDWRKDLQLRRNVIYGTRRVSSITATSALGHQLVAGQDIDTHGDPIGAFSLFWGQAPEAAKSPMFAVSYPSAGGVDSEFVWRWPPSRRRLLPILLLHYGRPFSNWFGVGKDDELIFHHERLLAGGACTINVAWPPKGEK